MSSATAGKKARRGQRYNPVPSEKRGIPNRKAHARLGRRIADYVRTVSDKNFKSPDGAFHKPGSNNS